LRNIVAQEIVLAIFDDEQQMIESFVKSQIFSKFQRPTVADGHVDGVSQKFPSAFQDQSVVELLDS
jgi:hypothetical protein